LDAVQALIVLFDASDGRMTAIMDGKSVTAIRTGAGSGLATDLLARSDSKVVAIFGSGVQARSHLRAVCAARPIERAVCIGRSADRADRFAEEMAVELDIEITTSPDPAVARVADVICTTTTAVEPILGLDDVAKGTHINVVGTHRPTDAEVSGDLVAASRVVVDQLEGCLAEAGDLVRPIEQGLIDESHIFAELGELALGDKPGRADEFEITLFKSVGNAVQDLAAAVEIVRAARKNGLGSPIRL
jgi:ornithine cyclodeaminase/alanine dehydrogenase-like protein (mu-crystallin family)